MSIAAQKPYLLGSGALLWLVLEHPLDDLLGGVGDVLGHAELASSDSMEEFLVGFTFGFNWIKGDLPLKG